MTAFFLYKSSWLAGGWLAGGWLAAVWLVVDADFNVKF